MVLGFFTDEIGGEYVCREKKYEFCSWLLQGPYDDKFLGAHAPFMNPYGIVNDGAKTQSEDLITGVNKYGANVTKSMGVRPMIVVAMGADK